MRTRYYTADWSEVLVYMEQWFLERFNPQNGKWVQVANQMFETSYTPFQDGFIVETVGVDGYSGLKFHVYHVLVSGSPLKIKVEVENNGESTQTVRLIWSLSGIVGANEQFTDNGLTACYGESESNYKVKVSWKDVVDAFGVQTVNINFASSAEGRKRDFTFGSFEVKAKSVLTVDPSVAGQSTSSGAIDYPFQRKAFDAEGLTWIPYYNGSRLVYVTSADGESWSNPVVVRTASIGGAFSFKFDGVYVHYVYAWVSKIYYRRGTPHSNGTVTWHTNEQEIATIGNNAIIPYISLDNDGYVWIGYRDYVSSNHYPFVMKSQFNNGTFGTPTITQLSTTANINWCVMVEPLANGKVVALYTYNSQPIRARVWNGSSWSEETTTTSNIASSNYISAVTQGEIAHVAFLKASTYDIVYTRFNASSNSFEGETVLVSSATSSTAPLISIDKLMGDLYVFASTKITNSPNGWTANHIYYCVYNATEAEWSAWTDWINEESEQLNSATRINAFPEAYERQIGLVYLTKTASPYNVKFAGLALPEPSEPEPTPTPTPEPSPTPSPTPSASPSPSPTPKPQTPQSIDANPFLAIGILSLFGGLVTSLIKKMTRY
jgi:hypothetical protein